MQYIVRALYPEDIHNRFVMALPYREWLTFDKSQTEWMPEAMLAFVARHYKACEAQHVFSYVRNRPMTDNITTPNVSVQLADSTVIQVFRVEVR